MNFNVYTVTPYGKLQEEQLVFNNCYFLINHLLFNEMMVERNKTAITYSYKSYRHDTAWIYKGVNYAHKNYKNKTMKKCLPIESFPLHFWVATEPVSVAGQNMDHLSSISDGHLAVKFPIMVYINIFVPPL